MWVPYLCDISVCESSILMRKLSSGKINTVKITPIS